MRLWHIDLIPFLPKSQLLAQWRELNSIFKYENKHILINYVYDYPKEYLQEYSRLVGGEMLARGYKINSYENYHNYFNGVEITNGLRFKEHNKEYFEICYYNLKEKYLRGQKDFSKEEWETLEKYYKIQKRLKNI